MTMRVTGANGTSTAKLLNSSPSGADVDALVRDPGKANFHDGVAVVVDSWGSR
jgi:hypothetical protein